MVPQIDGSHSSEVSSGTLAYVGGGGSDSIVKHALVTTYVDSFFVLPVFFPDGTSKEAAVRRPVLQGVCPRPQCV